LNEFKSSVQIEGEVTIGSYGILKNKNKNKNGPPFIF